MKRHDIKLRKEKFSASRIKEHKDYKQVLRKHRQARRVKSKFQLGALVFMLTMICGAIYFKITKKPLDFNKPEKKVLTYNDATKPQILDDTNTIINILGEKAMPVGGEEAYLKYLENNINYPKEAEAAKVEGKVLIQFLVNKDGALTDYRVVKSVGFGCDKEAIRLVKEGASWMPAIVDGKKKMGSMIVPVVFKLKD